MCILLAKIAKSYLQFYLDICYLLDPAEEVIAIPYNAKNMIFKVFGNGTMGVVTNTEFSIAYVVTFPTKVNIALFDKIILSMFYRVILHT